MTSTTAAPPLAPAPPLARWQRAVLGALAPLTALGNAAWAATVPFSVSDPPEVWIPAVAEAPGRLELALTFYLVAAVTIVPAALVVGSVARRGAPRLGTVGLVVAFVGATTSLLDGIAYDGFGLAATGMGLDTATIAALYAGYDALGPVAGVGVLFVCMPLGILLLGIALWTGRTVPRWAATAVVVGILVVVFGGFVVMPLMIAGWLLVAAGYAAAGMAFARR